jgi:hypothetical protein
VVLSAPGVVNKPTILVKNAIASVGNDPWPGIIVSGNIEAVSSDVTLDTQNGQGDITINGTVNASTLTILTNGQLVIDLGMATEKEVAAALTAGTLLVTLQACTTIAEGTASVAATAPAAATAPSGPALWKVADDDTTIYMFGTVHALPKDVDWYRGPIAAALASLLQASTCTPSVSR